MSRPNPGPTSLQVRFSNAKTTTESYRFGAEPGLPHRDLVVSLCVEGVDCRTGAAVEDGEPLRDRKESPAGSPDIEERQPHQDGGPARGRQRSSDIAGCRRDRALYTG